MYGLPWFDLIVFPIRPRGADATTRSRLLRAAVGIVREQGAPAVTLRAVARRAHVSPSRIQRYFPSRELLMEALVATLATGH